MGEEYVSRENQIRGEALQSRVALLKNIAIDIEEETKDQNVFLDHTDKEVMGVQSFLTSGRKRASQLLINANRDRKTMLYVAAGVTIFLFTTYYLLFHVSSASKL